MGGGWKAILKVKMSSECRKQELLYDRVTSNSTQEQQASKRQATSNTKEREVYCLLAI